MRKFPESQVLERYNRLIERKPYHEKIGKVEKASRDQVIRCIGEDAPESLLKLFSGRFEKGMTGQFNRYELGRICEANGNTDGAIMHFGAASNRGFRGASGRLGRIFLHKRHNPHAASFQLKKAVGEGDRDSFGEMGLAYAERGAWQEAKDFFNKAIALGQTEWHAKLADVCEQLGDREASRENLEKAFRYGDDDCLEKLFRLWFDSDDVNKEFDRFYSKLNSQDKVRCNIIVGYDVYFQGKISDNKEVMEDGMIRMRDAALDDTGNYWKKPYDVYMEEGRGKEAAELCMEMTEKGKKAFSELASAFMLMGRIKQARTTCIKGLEKGDTRCNYVLGQIAKESGNDETAMEWFKKAADSPDTRAYFMMGEIHEKKGETEEAKKNYRFAAECGQMSAEQSMEMVRFNIKNGFPEEAGEFFMEAIKKGCDEDEVVNVLSRIEIRTVRKLCGMATDAGFMRGHIWLAKILEYRGENIQAESEYRSAAAKGLKEGHLLAGRLFMKQKRYDMAVNEFQKALKEKIICYSEFGKALEMYGKTDKAIVSYRMGIDMGEEAAYEPLITLLQKSGKLAESAVLMELAVKKGIKLDNLLKDIGDNPFNFSDSMIKGNIVPGDLN